MTKHTPLKLTFSQETILKFLIHLTVGIGDGPEMPSHTEREIPLSQRVETNSDFRKILDAAKLQGWKTEHTKKGHWKFKSPNGKDMVHTSGSPSDMRAIKNFVARLRQRGLNIP